MNRAENWATAHEVNLMLRNRWILTCSTLLLVICSATRADTWRSVASGDFNSDSTWQNTSLVNGHPTLAADIARVYGTAAIGISSASTVGTFQIGYDASSTSSVNMTAGSLTISSYVAVGQTTGSNATFTQTGGSMSLGASKFYVGNSSSSSPGGSAGTTGTYSLSGNSTFSQSTANASADTYVGYQQSTFAASTGTLNFDTTGGGQMGFGYLYIAAGGVAGPPANLPTGTLDFKLGTDTTTRATANRLILANSGGTANLVIQLASAPTVTVGNTTSVLNYTLITVSTAGAVSAVDSGSFSNLTADADHAGQSLVTSTFAGITYGWDVSQTSGTSGKDLALINGRVVPEPALMAPCGLLLVALRRRARSRAISN